MFCRHFLRDDEHAQRRVARSIEHPRLNSVVHAALPHLSLKYRVPQVSTAIQCLDFSTHDQYPLAPQKVVRFSTPQLRSDAPTRTGALDKPEDTGGHQRPRALGATYLSPAPKELGSVSKKISSS